MSSFIRDMVITFPEMEYYEIGTRHRYLSTELSGRHFIVHERYGLGIIHRTEVFVPQPFERGADDIDTASIVASIREDIDNNSNVPIAYTRPIFAKRGEQSGVVVNLFYFESTPRPVAVLFDNGIVVCARDIDNLLSPDVVFCTADDDVLISGIAFCSISNGNITVDRVLRDEMKFAIAEILWNIRSALLECKERVEENKTLLENMRFYPLHELIDKICDTCGIFEREIKTFNPSPGA